MSKKKTEEKTQDVVNLESSVNMQLKFNPVIHYAIQLLALALLLILCYQILAPFMTLIVWGGVIAIAIYPTHKALTKRLGNRNYWSAGIISFFLVALIVVPAVWLMLSTFGEFKLVSEMYKAGNFAITPPVDDVKSWPIVGEKLYELWMQASTNLNSLVMEYSDILRKVAISVFGLLANTGKAVFLFFLSIIVCGLFLAFAEPAANTVKAVFIKLVGKPGEIYTDIAATTVRSVTKGVLGVALIQSILAGIGMVIVGIPFAGLWIILCIILSIVQIGVFPVTIGSIIYIWNTADTLTASIFTAWMIFVGVIDNILKPFMLGKTEHVPMPVVFIGSIGGLLFSGFIGLFTGAIVLSLAYKLFNAWLAAKNE